MSKKLYIMRGAPGSGKSFRAKELAGETGIVCSTDDFFPEDPDKYQELYERAIEEGFLAPLLCKFHRQNEERVVKAMEEGVSPIVVDNCNIKKSEIRPYVEAAICYDYEVEFAESQSEWWQEIRELLWNKKFNEGRLRWAAEKLAKRTVHRVPSKTIFEKYLWKWQDYKFEDFV